MAPRLLQEFLSSFFIGHSRVKVTIAHLATSFYWPSIRRDTKLFIKTCLTCQQNKPINRKPFGLLQPLPILAQVQDDLTMDFVTHLPTLFGLTVIWVIYDRLQKYTHFLTLPTHYTTPFQLTIFLWTFIGCMACRALYIVSNCDPLFLSQFWHKLQGTKLCFSTVYHPQSNNQMEVVNRSLEVYLQCFFDDHPHSWYKYLHLTKYQFNTSFHLAIQRTSFQALSIAHPLPFQTISQVVPLLDPSMSPYNNDNWCQLSSNKHQPAPVRA